MINASASALIKCVLNKVIKKWKPSVWPPHSFPLHVFFTTCLTFHTLHYLHPPFPLTLTLSFLNPSISINSLTVCQPFSHPLQPSGMLGKHSSAPQVPFPELMRLFFFTSSPMCFFSLSLYCKIFSHTCLLIPLVFFIFLLLPINIKTDRFKNLFKIRKTDDRHRQA